MRLFGILREWEELYAERLVSRAVLIAKKVGGRYDNFAARGMVSNEAEVERADESPPLPVRQQLRHYTSSFFPTRIICNSNFAGPSLHFFVNCLNI